MALFPEINLLFPGRDVQLIWSFICVSHFPNILLFLFPCRSMCSEMAHY